MKKVVTFGLAVFVAGCGTPEFRAEQTACETRWNAQIPVKLERQLTTRTETRQVPTGRSTCTSVGGVISCTQEMRTEFYEVPTVVTVDTNAYTRNLAIRACTQVSCKKKYGNETCRAS